MTPKPRFIYRPLDTFLQRRGTRTLMVLGLLLLVALAGCKPREIIPRQVSHLLPPEREQVAYRKLVLPNGLKVMLVSNPNATASGASMAVEVGSLGNPEDRPGLVHFLEHMLFLGTKKYPDPGGYSRFMAKFGGRSNAYTADDHTNYFFQISHPGFEEGLDRFAHFFIAPLLDQTYAEREMRAVNSEHAKNQENDYWRMHQVRRIHFNKSHPISRFSTGNQETLRGVGAAELRRFYRSTYSSNRMALAVVGNRSLDALEKMVRARFGQVPNRELAPLRYSPDYLEKKEALRLLRVVPVADLRQVSLHFPLPPVEKNFDAKPLAMISSILGHEGKGSLLSLLKADGLATSLSAGRSESTSDYASLDITIGLTRKGLENYLEVIEQTLGAIQGLRKAGIPRYLFEERRIMASLEERYKAVPGSGQIARRLTAMMLKYPLDSLPDQPNLLTRYDPGLYRALLEHLTPDNMLVTLVAKGLSTRRTEPYYGVRYSYDEIKSDDYTALLDAQPDPRWALPRPNRFIPGMVRLREPEGRLKLAGVSLRHMRNDGLPPKILETLAGLEGKTFSDAGALVARMETLLSPPELRQWLPVILKNALPLPQSLLNTSRARVWWIADWRLRQPKTEMVLRFHVEGAYRSPREAMLGELYQAVIEEDLNELGYPIKEAGLHYGISAVKEGISLTVGGYSARALDLLQVLVERLRTITISKETFAAIQDGMVRGLENRRLEQPYQQARYFGDMMLEAPNYTDEALLQELRGLTLKDVKAYAARFLRRTYLEGVVVGNLSPSQVRSGIRRALDTLGSQVLPPEKRTAERVRMLPAGANWLFTRRIDINNSVMAMMYQAGKSEPSLRGALLLIAKPMAQQFYHQMRTQQQLGYIVWAGMDQRRKTLYLYFLVQSGQYPADLLLKRIERFIPGFVESFKTLPPNAFEGYRQAVIQAKLRRPKSMGEVAQRLFWVAFEHDEKFDHVSTDIAAVERLTRQQVDDVLESLLKPRGGPRLGIRLVGKWHAQGNAPGRPVALPVAVRGDGG